MQGCLLFRSASWLVFSPFFPADDTTHVASQLVLQYSIHNGYRKITVRSAGGTETEDDTHKISSHLFAALMYK
jgi:hypothetical protein